MIVSKEAPLAWSMVSLVNNEQLLRSCLLNSPDVTGAKEVMLLSGSGSAAVAYNSALATAKTDILVFAHQDVFLPAGWILQVQKSLEWLDRNDPQWAVAGVWGVRSDGNRAGNVYCTGLGRELNQIQGQPISVRTLDEVLLILRKSSGIHFDERLPGYHFYGCDLCLEAERRGLSCYALPAFCIHNTNGYGFLPWQFWRSYLWMRSKWRHRLPVITPCMEITWVGMPMIHWNLDRALNILLGRHKPGRRTADPAKLFAALAASRKMEDGPEDCADHDLRRVPTTES